MKILAKTTVFITASFLGLILGDDIRETELSSINYNIKKNGAMLSLDYTKSINNDDIIGWKSDRNWLYLTLLGVKPVKERYPKPTFNEGAIKDIVIDDMGESVQVAVLMNKPIQWYDIINSEESNSSVIMIRTGIKTSNHENLKRHFSKNSGSPFVSVNNKNTINEQEAINLSIEENKSLKNRAVDNDIQWSDGLPESLTKDNSNEIKVNKNNNINNIDPKKSNESLGLVIDEKKKNSFLRNFLSRKKKNNDNLDNEFLLNPMYDNKSDNKDEEIVATSDKSSLKNRKKWIDKFIKLKNLNKFNDTHEIKNSREDEVLTEELKSHNNSKLLLEQLMKNNKGLLSRKNIQEFAKTNSQKRRFSNYNHSAILVDTNIDGVPIYIDGRYVGHSPLEKPIKVEPGWHQISGFSPQYLMYLNTGSINYVDRHNNNNRVFGNETIFVENGKVAYSKMSFEYKGPKLPAKLKKSNMKLSVPFVLLFIQLFSWATT